MARFVLTAIFTVALLVEAFAQLAANPVFDRRPPSELAAPFHLKLLGTGFTAKISEQTTLDFWWVSSLDAGTPPSWSSVPEGTLIGAVRVTGPFREIRGRTIKPGVYTLRYGLQPQNGDHLGASPFREFLLLSPAASDTDPKTLGFDATVALAKQTTGTSHPATLSIDPPASTSTGAILHTSELGHKGFIVEIRTPGGPFRFGLIVLGLIEA